MGEAFLEQKKSSGIKLNDVIEDFKYVYKGQKIKAGDLVNYIEGVAGKTDYGTSTDTVINSNGYTGYIISAATLDENRVFIAHSYNSNHQLYGVVCKINGNTITVGTDTIINSSAYTGDAISVVALDSTRVFIAHSNGTSSNDAKCVMGIVCTVSDTTFTIGTDTQITSASYTGYALSACLLSNGDVFIAHSYGSSFYLYGIVCTISGTTITKGTDTVISNSDRDGFSMSTCLLSDGKVFIAHSYSTNYYLYGVVVSISGTTITKGTDTALNTTTARTGEKISTTLLPNGNVFIANSYSTSYYLYGTVCSISGTTITKGDNTQISGNTYAGFAFSTTTLPDGNVFIAFCTDSSKFLLYGVVCEVSDTTITVGTATQLSTNTHTGYRMSAITLKNGTIFIAHSYSSNYHLYSQIFGIDEANNIPTKNIVITEYEQQVTPATEPPFNAIALSSGEGGTDTEHNEQVKIARLSLLSSLPVGSLIKDVNSTFLGEPVIWRIADINHEGYPDNSVTLIADKILALRAFDADEPNNSNTDRKSFGNNRYSVSNIRQWLNSDAKAGQWYSAQHSADQAPTVDYVYEGYNAYSDKVGFLNGFSDNFKKSLLDTQITVALNTATDGGGSETVTDKIFLASNTEVGLANENSIVEGKLLPIFSDDTSRIASVTAKGLEDSNYTSEPAEGAGWWWWLRTPYSSTSARTRAVYSTGTNNYHYTHFGHFGVRPLCNISSSTIVSPRTDADGCYTLLLGGGN